MKKDILFVVVQYLLFALYFTGWNFYDFGIPTWICYLAIGLIIIGLIVVLFGILNLNESLSPFPSPKSNSSLISNGIYKYIRHPIYAGIMLSMLAYAIFEASPFKLLVTLILGIIFYFKTNLEEKLLMQRYVQYKNYKNTTGRFFPKRTK